MTATQIQSCYLGPHISPEQFMAEHIFIHLAEGQIEGYDGNRHYILRAGDSCIVRKNHLARYNKSGANGAFSKVVVFDEAFLKSFA
jgi:quercetin dioxygenase-like cupin family protein